MNVWTIVIDIMAMVYKSFGYTLNWCIIYKNCLMTITRIFYKIYRIEYSLRSLAVRDFKEGGRRRKVRPAEKASAVEFRPLQMFI